MKSITVGDIVNIYFERADAEHEVKVLFVESDPGGWWEFERVDGTIINVQSFCKMVKVR